MATAGKEQVCSFKNYTQRKSFSQNGQYILAAQIKAAQGKRSAAVLPSLFAQRIYSLPALGVAAPPVTIFPAEPGFLAFQP